LKRVTLIRDESGERIFPADAYPLALGGAGSLLPIPGVEESVAYIGLEQGHPFIQPQESGPVVWHNHERLTASVWLKSGDRIQIGETLILWQVQGDQIILSLGRGSTTPTTPPAGPPPVQAISEGLQPPAAEQGQAGGWGLGLATGIFLLLVLAAVFVLRATPVTLEIEPEPDTYSLTGNVPALPLPGRFLVLPGEYRLQASRDGYRAFEQKLVIEFGKSEQIMVALKKLPGLLDVETAPAGASLRIDGETRGSTPIKGLELAAGRHLLKLEADRYQGLEQELVMEGLGRQQQIRLELQPDWAGVSLHSEPAGAEIREQGRLLGITPIELELLSGQHSLTLSLAGYKRHLETFSVQAQSPQERPLITLQRADGRLKISSRPAGVTVSVDNSFRGTTPLELTLSSGDGHLIKLSKAGYRPTQRSVQLAAEEQKRLEVTLQPEVGVLFITSQPADATLYVDGKSRGPATRRIELPSRPHRIELRRPGYISYRETITPRSDRSRQLDVVLKRLGAVGQKNRSSVSSQQTLKLIRPGSPFTMGASRREPGRRANEYLRQVQLTRSYLIGRREVNNGEFRRFRAGHDSGSAGGVSLDGDQQPVVNVSWDDAARYLNWLSEKEGLPAAYLEQDGKIVLRSPVATGYRLPSEAEWAYAARFTGAGQGRRFPWEGDGYPPTLVHGNYADRNAGAQLPLVLEDYQDGFAVSAPVASFPADGAGLHDIDGNVAEWVHDYYSVYPNGRGKTARDPLGPDAGRHHVVRGSSWRDAGLSELRLSYRDYSDKPRNDLGFRVARYTD